MINNVTRFALEILNMQEELAYLREENAKLREIEKEYNKFVADSLSHNLSHDQVMMGHVLDAALQGAWTKNSAL